MADDRRVTTPDQSATRSRDMTFDANGGLVAAAELEPRPHYPNHGWVARKANRLWRVQRCKPPMVLADPPLGARSINTLAAREQTLLRGWVWAGS